MASARYTHGHHESVLRSHRWRTIENSASYLRGELQPGRRVLDVGCGPGTITAEFVDAVSPGRVVGVDAAADVIAAANATLEPTSPRATFVVGDTYGLEFPEASFDVVHAHQVLQHLADPVRALREWRRVCAPGGVVAARDADYAAMAWYPRVPLLDRWMELYQLAARANLGEPDAGRQLHVWARQAEFTDVATTASVWCFASPADRAWWGLMWADRIVSSAIAGQLIAAGHSDEAELHTISRAWTAWTEHPDGWFLVPHGEIICRV